jgi:hypothetical protein
VITFKASFSRKTVRANVPSSTNNVLTTAVVRRALRSVATSVLMSASTVQIAGHAGTPARAGSFESARARRRSFVFTGDASAKVNAAIRMRPAIALNVRYRLHNVLERSFALGDAECV